MENEWSGIREQTSYLPEEFTPEVYQTEMSGRMHTGTGGAGICHRSLQERLAAIGEVGVVPEGEANLIACYVPGLELEIVVPPWEVGYSEEEIRTLEEVIFNCSQNSARSEL